MIKIALAGNPNCGKTMLFNEFTAFHHIRRRRLLQETILLTRNRMLF